MPFRYLPTVDSTLVHVIEEVAVVVAGVDGCGCVVCGVGMVVLMVVVGGDGCGDCCGNGCGMVVVVGMVVVGH